MGEEKEDWRGGWEVLYNPPLLSCWGFSAPLVFGIPRRLRNRLQRGRVKVRCSAVAALDLGV